MPLVLNLTRLAADAKQPKRSSVSLERLMLIIKPVFTGFFVFLVDVLFAFSFLISSLISFF